MPVETIFLRDNRVVSHTWYKPITIEDINKAFNSMAPLYDKATEPVHTIFVHLHAANLPPNVISVALRHPNSPFSHPKSGRLVIVATDPFLRAMGRTVGRLRPNKVTLVSTLDEALARIDDVLTQETLARP
jgi:hypothetical protein